MKSAAAAVGLVLALIIVAGCGDDGMDIDGPIETVLETTIAEDAPESEQTQTTVPAQTDPAETVAFNVYLLASGEICDDIVAVPVNSTVEASLDNALSVLLAGPTAEEEGSGLHSWFSSDTAALLSSVTIDGNVAMISFDSALRSTIPNASSSCGSAGLLAQLDATVLQFDGVEQAIYSLDGDVAGFYEWLQMSAPVTN